MRTVVFAVCALLLASPVLAGGTDRDKVNRLVQKTAVDVSGRTLSQIVAKAKAACVCFELHGVVARKGIVDADAEQVTCLLLTFDGNGQAQNAEPCFNFEVLN